MNRRALLRGLGVGGVGLVGAALIGCSDDEDEMADATAAPATATAAMTAEPTATEMMMDVHDHDLGPAKDFALVEGWHRGDDVVYYDFGMQSPMPAGNVVGVAPIYAFITGIDADGNPQFVEGQHNIVDVVPGDEGYSDLWEVNLVTVPDGYEPDSITSKDALDAAGFEMMKPGLFVNCPVVPAGSTFENGEALTQGWYRDARVYYPDFGPNPAFAIPIWAFITGMDAGGTPQFVEGQRNVIDSLPGDAGYSAFWRVNLVHVPEGYEANTLTAAADVAAFGYEITETDLMVNCPVVERMM